MSTTSFIAEDVPLDQLTSYLECIARSPRDPDMQGYAVRLSTFIANLCLAILIRSSNEDVMQSVGVVLLQIYTILLATFFSMWRHHLHIADAHFALASTISPLSIYLLWTTVRRLMNKRSTLYERMTQSRVLVATFIFLMPILWIILDSFIYFGSVFRDQCQRPTFAEWAFFQLKSVKSILNWAVFLLPGWPFFYVVYALRHFGDIREEYQRHMGKVVRWHRYRWVQMTWFSVRSFWLSQWVVITYSHPWFILLGVAICYATWAGMLKLWVLDVGLFYNNLLREIHGGTYPAYEQPIDYDPLSYGQLLAATIAIEPLYQVFKLCCVQHRQVVESITTFPSYFWDGIVFLFTGSRNPWHEVRQTRAFSLPSYPNNLKDSGWEQRKELALPPTYLPDDTAMHRPGHIRYESWCSEGDYGMSAALLPSSHGQTNSNFEWSNAPEFIYPAAAKSSRKGPTFYP